MDRPARLRRLIDLPGVAELEYRALLKREFAEPEARAAHPEIDACSQAIFGLTADQAEAHPRPAGWDGPETRPVLDQVQAFEAAGWDVTNEKRRPLRTFAHFNQQLWLAVRGVAGSLPFQPEDTRPDAWAASLAADAKRFRNR